MRRLAAAAASTLAMSIALAVLAPGGAAEQGIDPAQARPPLLSPPLLLLALGAQEPLPPSDSVPRGAIPGLPHLDESSPGCFREGPSRPCVQVCAQFVRSARCDRFPSAADGCLRMIGPRRARCLDAPPMARPTHLSWGR